MKPRTGAGKGLMSWPRRKGDRRATLLATGSEVAIAMAARDQLQGLGIPTAVVSMPLLGTVRKNCGS